MLIAITIFLLVYVAILSEKINKTVLVLLGSALMLTLSIIPFEKAIRHIDMNVILLLIGMMLIVKIAEKSGVFEWITVFSAKKAKANPIVIMVILFFITAIFSAFLDNVTTILLISPISLLLTAQLGISPIPYLIVEIIASNVGGTATLIGDPPNIMIGSAASLTFLDFLQNLAPIIIIQLFVLVFFFVLIFRKKLIVEESAKKRLMAMSEKKLIRDKPLLIKSLIVLGLVICGFMFHGLLHVEASAVALLGASVLILWTKTDADELITHVEWTTILFFIGLFIMVGALDYTGVIKKIAQYILVKTGGDIKYTSITLLFFTGITSGILDNIPLVATFIPTVKYIGTQVGADAITPMWWSLALGSCLGGNGTLVGASANVIMMNFAKRNKINLSFGRYMIYGIPFTLLTLIMAYFYIILRYF
ncbi:MAG: ArsB/NhaD family transporter [Spirochaetes bacterium]|nr:ArsB/NhaD family transporter [Spirochaetota bacterium]